MPLITESPIRRHCVLLSMDRSVSGLEALLILTPALEQLDTFSGRLETLCVMSPVLEELEAFSEYDVVRASAEESL